MPNVTIIPKCSIEDLDPKTKEKITYHPGLEYSVTMAFATSVKEYIDVLEPDPDEVDE